MAKTSRDARRHMREWCEFFADSKAVANILVDEFIKRHKKKKYLRQSLKRMIARGIVEERGRTSTLTKRGHRFFRRYSAIKSEREKWDGKWFLISFDIPVALNLKRDRLRYILREYNFYPLQKSVWIAPNKLAADLWEFVVEEELDKYCKVMIVNVIEGEEELKKHFKTSLV